MTVKSMTAELGIFRRDLGCGRSSKYGCGCANRAASAPGCGRRCGTLGKSDLNFSYMRFM